MLRMLSIIENTTDVSNMEPLALEQSINLSFILILVDSIAQDISIKLLAKNGNVARKINSFLLKFLPLL